MVNTKTMEATLALLLENIKRIRKEKGLTQKDIAEASDMLVPTYSRIERGGSTPGLSTIVRIAGALDVPVIELFLTSEIKDRSIAQKLEMVEKLSEYNRSVVNILLDSIIEKDALEKAQEAKMKNRLSELERVRSK